MLFTPFTALVFLIFTLLYTPCVAAIDAVKRELGGGRAALGQVLLLCVFVWVLAFAVHCVGEKKKKTKLQRIHLSLFFRLSHREVYSMSLHSILVLVIIFVLLGVAIGFIANSEKGWHGGCTGNCASCQEHCNDKQKKNPPKQQ